MPTPEPPTPTHEEIAPCPFGGLVVNGICSHCGARNVAPTHERMRAISREWLAYGPDDEVRLYVSASESTAAELLKARERIAELERRDQVPTGADPYIRGTRIKTEQLLAELIGGSSLGEWCADMGVPDDAAREALSEVVVILRAHVAEQADCQHPCTYTMPGGLACCDCGGML